MIYENDFFYIIKIKKDSVHFKKIEANEYGIPSNDEKLFENIPSKFNVLIVIFETLIDKPEKIYIASCTSPIIDKRLQFTKDVEITDNLVVSNFLNSISLDIKEDYNNKSYVIKCFSVEILKEFVIALQFNKNKWKASLAAMPIQTHSDYKQDSKCAIYKYEDEIDSNRDKFERDRDRIIHSKASRRLVDKAQIFTSSKGDHYRTRMTHTLEVNQIARSLARYLKLNEPLTEAIALGHDLGHTPFGHIGERTLDDILSGKEVIIKNIKDFPELCQRFKHNYQALRILTHLEDKYSYYSGLNLSYQTMEGILKHTKIQDKEYTRLLAKKDKSEEEREKFETLEFEKFNIDEFFKYEDKQYLYLNYENSTSLEGQVVAVADEIAQRAHDIDDAFKSGKLNHETFSKLRKIKSSSVIKDIDEKIIKKIKKSEEDGMLFADKDDIYRAQICSKIIGCLIDDVVKQTNNNKRKIKNVSSGVYTKKVVDFSKEGKIINSLLENIVYNQVINSSEVAKFDTTAANIIKTLFNYYYQNPLCLEQSTLVKIYKEMLMYTSNSICFTNGCIGDIRNEIELINKKNLTVIEMDPQLLSEYKEKRKIFARCIADYISGMTDSYALNEFQRITNMLNFIHV